MSSYQVHTIETAPEGSRASLLALKQGVGRIPNLAAAMAESPELLRGFLAIREIFYGGTFTSGEVQVLALTSAFENGCTYCMAFHSWLARQAGVSGDTIQALRAGRSPVEERLEALSNFARALVRERGRPGEEELRAFHAAGYTRAQALEVVLGIAVSILPNFAHHLTGCPLDQALAAERWSGAYP